MLEITSAEQCSVSWVVLAHRPQWACSLLALFIRNKAAFGPSGAHMVLMVALSLTQNLNVWVLVSSAMPSHDLRVCVCVCVCVRESSQV